MTTTALIRAAGLRQTPPDEAAGLATEQLTAYVAELRALDPADWSKPTDCSHWDVRRIAAHIAGELDESASTILVTAVGHFAPNSCATRAPLAARDRGPVCCRSTSRRRAQTRNGIWPRGWRVLGAPPGSDPGRTEASETRRPSTNHEDHWTLATRCSYRFRPASG
jgi:hypothetical protein